MTENALNIVQCLNTRTIGLGSFGEVFEARDTRKGNLVALKRMKLGLGREDGVPATAIREIAALRHLRHPCIVMYVIQFSSKGLDVWIRRPAKYNRS